MKRDILRGAREPSGGDVENRWTTLAYDDIRGIDGDIERLLRRMQERHGYTRDRANVELVRRLSFAA